MSHTERPLEPIELVPATSKTLVSDFDGTMTAQDFFWLALDTLPAHFASIWDQYTHGNISHFEALHTIFSALRCDTATIDLILKNMQLDEYAAPAYQNLRNKGWNLVIASAGCDWYIRRLLEPLAIDAQIHANPGTYSPATGLTMHLPTDSPFFNQNTGIDKIMIMNAAIQRGTTAFAGDGRPDLGPALLTPPYLRFAKGWLAEELERRNEPFIRFDRWSEVVEHLLNGDTQC